MLQLSSSLSKIYTVGRGYQFQRISDAPDLIRTLYLFKQHRPTIRMPRWFAVLSEESPDWYDYDDDGDNPCPPFKVELIVAGSSGTAARRGWRWKTESYCIDAIHSCEIKWL